MHMLVHLLRAVVNCNEIHRRITLAAIKSLLLNCVADTDYVRGETAAA